jgi:hypothetical protein
MPPPEPQCKPKEGNERMAKSREDTSEGAAEGGVRVGAPRPIQANLGALRSRGGGGCSVAELLRSLKKSEAHPPKFAYASG